MSAVHLEVLPKHRLRIRIAHKLLEPRCGQSVSDVVLHARQEVDAMAEDGRVVHSQRTSQLHRVESHLSEPCEVVAIKSRVVSTRKQRETYIGAVLYRRILQRLATCHRTRRRPIVGVERGETLTAITALADAEHVESVGIHLAARQTQTNKLFEGILLRQMPPAIVFALVRNLRNEIDRRRILEAETQFDTIRPFSVLRARTVCVEEERVLTIGSHTLLAVIIRHDRIRLQALRQVPGAVLSQLQFGRLYELFLLQRIVRLAPCCPNHFLIVGYVLVLYCCLKFSVERSVLSVVGLAILLQCFLLRLKRLLEVVVHLFLQVLRLRRCVSRIG